MSSTTHIVTVNLAMMELARQLDETAAQMEADAAAKRYEANRLRAMADDGFKAPIRPEVHSSTMDPQAIPAFLVQREAA
jgi:hypothetical protein